jgi:hypothetical protein
MPRRRMEEWSVTPHFLTLALGGREWSASRLGRFTARESAPNTHWIGSWVGPRAGLDDVEKIKISFPCQESNFGLPARNQLLYQLSYPGSYSLSLPLLKFQYSFL